MPNDKPAAHAGSLPHGRLGRALTRFAPAILLLLALPLRAAELALPAPPETGQEIARRIRSMEPTENSEIKGTLEIALKKNRRQVPVTCQIVARGSTWETIYQALATANSGAERLVIVHNVDGPNQYLYARAGSPAEAAPAPARISALQAAATPFAGSDFSLGDLGMDYLHWPQQERQKGQMRLGQACYVLESRTDQGGEIVRVRSFIDQETGGPLIAEAYDKNDKIVKEFSLHGSSFKKVNGQWRLEKMEITNEKTDSQTTLKFELNQ